MVWETFSAPAEEVKPAIRNTSWAASASFGEVDCGGTTWSSTSSTERARRLVGMPKKRFHFCVVLLIKTGP